MYREHQQLCPARNLFCYFESVEFFEFSSSAFFPFIVSSWALSRSFTQAQHVRVSCVSALQLCLCGFWLRCGQLAACWHCGTSVSPGIQYGVPGGCALARECVLMSVCMFVCVYLIQMSKPRNSMYLNLNIFIAIICNIAEALFVLMVHMPLNCVWSNAFSNVNLIACPCFLTCRAHLQTNICIIMFTKMEKATINIYPVTLIRENI